jgi:hypothetical protein
MVYGYHHPRFLTDTSSVYCHMLVALCDRGLGVQERFQKVERRTANQHRQATGFPGRL